MTAPPPVFSFGSQYFREMILNEIRKARELYSGTELAAELSRIQQRLDNVECLSVDIVINLLLTYRDIQVSSLLCVCLFVCFIHFGLGAAMALSIQILPLTTAALLLLKDSLGQQASRKGAELFSRLRVGQLCRGPQPWGGGGSCC